MCSLAQVLVTLRQPQGDSAPGRWGAHSHQKNHNIAWLSGLYQNSAMNQSKPSVKVVDHFKHYTPPTDVRTITLRLLRHVPRQYLFGLGHVVLTNATALPRHRRRSKTWARGRKVSIARALGMYHAKTNTHLAWIEIFVDNNTILQDKVMRRVPIFRDLALAEVLYHKVGHHIHTTLRPEHREPEDVADKWERILTALYFRKQYWYLMPIIYLCSPIAKTKTLKRFMKRMNKRFG